MLDYRLTVFQAVAEELHFTRAAARLHITQPAVTRHIRQLEAHYGVTLFERGASGVRLTEAGRTLLKQTQGLAALSAATEAVVRARRPSVSGPLRLAASTTVAQYFLPSRLAAFHRQHPEVTLSLKTGNTEDVVSGLLAGRVDLGLIEGPAGHRELRTEAFFDDELVCVAPSGHPLGRLARVTVATLATHPFILREPGSGTRRVVERALAAAGLKLARLRCAFVIQDTETIKGLVIHGAGLAFVSRLAVQAEVAAGTLVVLPVADLRLVRPFSFVSAQGPRQDGPAGAFMDFLRESPPTT